MGYYHTVLDVRPKKRAKRVFLLSLDDSVEEVKRIAGSLTKNESFLFSGKTIHPSTVDGISVFRSTKPTTELVLPNKKNVADIKNSECMPAGCCKHKYIGKCLIQGKVNDVEECTDEFNVKQDEANSR